MYLLPLVNLAQFNRCLQSFHLIKSNMLLKAHLVSPVFVTLELQ